MAKRDGKANSRRINLALQGGGAHGAFTWGVIERLLDEPGLEIAGISGTSAGALNGAALKQGLLTNGIEGARAELERLWVRVGAVGDMRLQNWMTALVPFASSAMQVANMLTPVSLQGVAAQFYSPYLFGDNWRNPLDPVVRRFRFDKVCETSGPALFVCATNVRTGKIRIFEGQEITPEALLASACLPTVFQTVELVDPATGKLEAYWDGGYSGNPALFPLFRPDLPDDVIVVQINPLRREEIPLTPVAIQNRINEISFNSSLLRELRAIHFVRELIAEGRIERGTMKDVRLHMISDDALMTELGVETKLTPSPILLHRLRMAGRDAAERFLTDHGGDIGERGSVDLPAMFG
ncbi:MAG: patatin-like phospholipase family protein [Gemmobacter sp.]